MLHAVRCVTSRCRPWTQYKGFPHWCVSKASTCSLLTPPPQMQTNTRRHGHAHMRTQAPRAGQLDCLAQQRSPSMHMAASSMQVRLAFSDGLCTTVFPAARAGAIFHCKHCVPSAAQQPACSCISALHPVHPVPSHRSSPVLCTSAGSHWATLHQCKTP